MRDRSGRQNPMPATGPRCPATGLQLVRSLTFEWVSNKRSTSRQIKCQHQFINRALLFHNADEIQDQCGATKRQAQRKKEETTTKKTLSMLTVEWVESLTVEWVIFHDACTHATPLSPKCPTFEGGKCAGCLKGLHTRIC